MVVARTVERQRLSEQIATQLRLLILGGELTAGQTLPPERELARRFAVSSTVIREALSSLSVSGLVDIRHGVGSFVTLPDQWHMTEPIALLLREGRATLLQVVEVRTLIEVATSGIVAARRDEAVLHGLDDALAHMAASTDDPVANVTADMAFHLALAAGVHNPILPLVLQPLLAPIRATMLQGTRLPTAMSRALAEHTLIRDAIQSGDAEAARAAMGVHMNTARVEISALATPSEAIA